MTNSLRESDEPKKRGLLEVNPEELWFLQRLLREAAIQNIHDPADVAIRIRLKNKLENMKMEAPTKEVLILDTSVSISLIEVLGSLTGAIRQLGGQLQQKNKIEFLTPLTPEEALSLGVSVDGESSGVS